MRVAAQLRVSFGAGLLVAALSFVPTAYALGAGLPALLPAVGGTYKSQTPVTISVPASIDGIDMGSIRVELDQIDVTDTIRKESGRFVIRPAQPLTIGAHALIMVARTAKGQLVELGSWSINVTGASPGAAATSIGIESRNAIEAMLLLSDQNIEQGRDRIGVTGAGDAKLGITSGKWSMSSAANYFLDSKRRFTATDEVFDIGEHATTMDYRGEGWKAGLVAGQHDPGYDNFLMSGFSRRGFSLHGGSESGRVTAKTFSTSSETLVGTDDTFGTNDSSGHVTGAGATVRPFDLGKNDLSITALTYTGEQGNNSASTAFPGGVANATGGRGDGGGWGTSIDSAWLDRRLKLQGELAKTNFDPDGGGAAAEETGNAVAIRSSYDFIQTAPVTLRVGGAWEKVDTFFNSLANPGLARDRETLLGYTDVTWSRLSTSLRVSREDNNIDELANVPTDRTYTGGIDGRYEIDLARKGPEELSWAGQPFLLIGGSTRIAERLRTPVGYTGQDTDQIHNTYYVGAGSNHSTVGWQLVYQFSDIDDRANNANDTRSSLGQATVNWTPGNRLSVNASLQANQNIRGTDDNESYTYNALLGLRAALVPKEIDLTFDYNLNLATGSGDTPDKHLFTSEVNWTLREAKVNQPGIAVALRGSLETNNGNTSSTLNSTKYEGFLVLRINAPVSTR